MWRACCVGRRRIANVRCWSAKWWVFARRIRDCTKSRRSQPISCDDSAAGFSTTSTSADLTSFYLTWPSQVAVAWQCISEWLRPQSQVRSREQVPCQTDLTWFHWCRWRCIWNGADVDQWNVFLSWLLPVRSEPSADFDEIGRIIRSVWIESADLVIQQSRLSYEILRAKNRLLKFCVQKNC